MAQVSMLLPLQKRNRMFSKLLSLARFKFGGTGTISLRLVSK